MPLSPVVPSRFGDPPRPCDDEIPSTRLAEDPIELSLIVPTYNEAPNVAELVRRVAAAVAIAGVDAEIVFVDDSTDATPDVIREVASSAAIPVRLIHRDKATGGLGGAVVAGLVGSSRSVGAQGERRVIAESRFAVTNASLQAEMVQLVVDFPPGAWTSWHTHGGQAINLVLEGEITLRHAGMERPHSAGQAWTDSTGQVHAAGNTGPGKARLLTNFILIQRGYLPAIVHSIERQRYYEALRHENDTFTSLIVESLQNSIETSMKFFQEIEGLRIKRAS